MSKKSLFKAISNNDIAALKQLIERGVNINCHNKNGTTALMSALTKGRMKIAEILLENGANIKDKDLDFALMKAVEFGHAEITKILLEKGANIYAKNPNGYNPLRLAITYDHIDVVKTLIEKGVDINAQNNGYTVLMTTSQNGKSKMVAMLLKNGANANLRNLNGQTALMLASQHNRVKAVKALLENGANINTQDYSGYTALMLTIMRGQTDAAKILIENGANIKTRGQNGHSALTFASWDDSPRIVEALIKHGADVNAEKNHGYTALMLAIINSAPDTMEVLIKNGADINAKTQDEETTLMLAIIHGFGNYTDVVEILLKNRVEINAKGPNGQTALIFAVINNRIKVVKMLLENGADIDIQNQNGKTALDLAKLPEIREILIKEKITKIIGSQTEPTDTEKDFLQQNINFSQEEASQQSKLNSHLLLHILSSTSNLRIALNLKHINHSTALRFTYENILKITKSGGMGQFCAKAVKLFEQKTSLSELQNNHQISPNIALFQNSITNHEESTISEILQKTTRILNKNTLSLDDVQFALDFINYDYLEILKEQKTYCADHKEFPFQKEFLQQEETKETTFLEKLGLQKPLGHTR